MKKGLFLVLLLLSVSVSAVGMRGKINQRLELAVYEDGAPYPHQLAAGLMQFECGVIQPSVPSRFVESCCNRSVPDDPEGCAIAFRPVKDEDSNCSWVLWQDNCIQSCEDGVCSWESDYEWIPSRFRFVVHEAGSGRKYVSEPITNEALGFNGSIRKSARYTSEISDGKLVVSQDLLRELFLPACFTAILLFLVSVIAVVYAFLVRTSNKTRFVSHVVGINLIAWLLAWAIVPAILRNHSFVVPGVLQVVLFPIQGVLLWKRMGLKGWHAFAVSLFASIVSLGVGMIYWFVSS